MGNRMFVSWRKWESEREERRLLSELLIKQCRFLPTGD